MGMYSRCTEIVLAWFTYDFVCLSDASADFVFMVTVNPGSATNFQYILVLVSETCDSKKNIRKHCSVVNPSQHMKFCSLLDTVRRW